MEEERNGQANHLQAVIAHNNAALAYTALVEGNGGIEDVEIDTDLAASKAGAARGQSEAADHASGTAQWIDAHFADERIRSGWIVETARAAIVVHEAAAAAHREAILGEGTTIQQLLTFFETYFNSTDYALNEEKEKSIACDVEPITDGDRIVGISIEPVNSPGRLEFYPTK